jgi:hypothetical protein
MDIPIYMVRTQDVVLSQDVAPLFGYNTGKFNERIRYNSERFEGGFGFQLTEEEWDFLVSKNGIPKAGRGGNRFAPWVFSEHGVVMAATLLKSDEAIAASRFIVKTFVAARRALVRAPGQNLPAALPVGTLLPLGDDARAGLSAKLNGAMTRVLDAIANPEQDTTVRDEARSIALEGLNAVKARLKAHEIGNEKTLAEIQKLLAEAEALSVEIEARHIENDHRRLAYLAKQLQIVIEMQSYTDTGSVDGLLRVLRDLGGAASA